MLVVSEECLSRTELRTISTLQVKYKFTLLANELNASYLLDSEATRFSIDTLFRNFPTPLSIGLLGGPGVFDSLVSSLACLLLIKLIMKHKRTVDTSIFRWLV